jgi:nucleotide-binding universal stress UspA family protein
VPAKYSRILVPTDGSEVAQRAIISGLELAKALDARATILAVTETLSSLGERGNAFSGLPEPIRQQALDNLDADARQSLDFGLSMAKKIGVSADATMIEADQVYQAIIDVAEARGADLVVMGSHGRRGITAALLGSVTQKVLTHSKVPVLVVK